jgi:hypothetical protein
MRVMRETAAGVVPAGTGALTYMVIALSIKQVCLAALVLLEGLIRVTQGTPEPQGTPEQAQPLWGIILAVGQLGMQVPVEMPVPQARRGRRVTRQGPL